MLNASLGHKAPDSCLSLVFQTTFEGPNSRETTAHTHVRDPSLNSFYCTVGREAERERYRDGGGEKRSGVGSSMFMWAAGVKLQLSGLHWEVGAFLYPLRHPAGPSLCSNNLNCLLHHLTLLSSIFSAIKLHLPILSRLRKTNI